VPAAGRRPRHPRHLAGLDQRAATRRSARLALHPRRVGVRHGAEQAPPDDELGHGANWRRGARCEPRPPARRTAPGAGTHLVHEHRHDLGDDGQGQPTLTACISGKSQP
jgi:hypothetical protein